eukprot:TRINITY_DN39667_c0_g1_i1.p1 TRINITY_DN39667_c0_g1~~TRINITY_DN39667_c0_g1_i1.p1  ORF type:complete len:250 (+),score=40.33 TRINITY_DN39667_c0_g1_i1:129-878(+)
MCIRDRSTGVPSREMASRFLAPLMIALSLLIASAAAGGVSIDIHVPVTGAAYDAALAANQFLIARLGDGIDLTRVDKPHITLYLTQWKCPSGTPEECVQTIKDAVTQTVSQFAPCPITLSQPYAAGTYAMLNVSLTPCLQRYSDLVVNATFQYAAPNQSAPAWVKTLPEPTRSEKLRDIALYGSPNVFSQFQPHVSFGWSANTSAVTEGVAALLEHWESASYNPELVAMGTVGPHGTVIRGKDYANFTF